MVLTTESRFFVGVDLGQTQDHTAIAMVERIERQLPEIDPATWERLAETAFVVRGVRRVPLGTRYPDVVALVGEVAAKAPAGSLTLVVDATGVGAPVVDMMRESIPGVRLVPVVFTAGSSARQDNGVHKVPKKDLVHGLVLMFERGLLKMPDQLPSGDVLRSELRNLRLKITPDGHAGYEAWREGQHDDLVFALALACWRARSTQYHSMEQNRPILW
jgi:hypothetical protein